MIVANGAKTILAGLGNMKAAMVADYAKFMPPKDEVTKKMNEDYANNFTITYGKKYIKITEKGGGVKAFVVGVDNDKKFRKGDILKAAGYNAPARNAARGNIFDGGYPINWTGPLGNYEYECG